MGYGIYFGDEFKVSHQYTTEGDKRYMFVADVALGNCLKCTKHNTTLIAPPSEYPAYCIYFIKYLLFLITQVIIAFVESNQLAANLQKMNT